MTDVSGEKKLKVKVGDNAIEVIIPDPHSDENVMISIFDYDDFCVTTIFACRDGLQEFISKLQKEL